MSGVGIVGGGVIGSAAAVWLMAEGHEVTLFEAEPDAWHASSGNAGILAVPEIEPMANWHTLLTAPRWLFDPEGPLSLRWRDLPALLPWLTRFALSTRPSRIATSTGALASLMQTAVADHRAMAELAGLSAPFRRTGGITVFDHEKSRDRAFDALDEASALLGSTFSRLSADEVRQRVPALTGSLAGGIEMPDYHMVGDPRTFLDRLRSHVKRRGEFVSAHVAAIDPGESTVRVETDGQSHSFDQVLIAGGVWSRELVRRLGLKVLLETERGYNTTWAEAPVDLPVPLTFAEHGFVATPLDGKLRIGGAVELAAVDAPANMKRARALRDRFRRYVPDLPEQGGFEWMGRRPSTPDTVPVICRHPDDRRILMAFGHGHLGLTLSAVTGRLVAEMAKGRDIAHAPAFDVRRFQ